MITIEMNPIQEMLISKSQITPFGVYKLYLSLKLHFTTANYRFEKYGINHKYTEDAFNLRKDRLMFERIAYKMKFEGPTMYALLPLFMSSNNWIGKTLEKENQKEAFDLQARFEGLKYHYRISLETYNELLHKKSVEFIPSLSCSGGRPFIVSQVLRGEVSKETLILLDRAMGLFKSWEKAEKDELWSQLVDFCDRFGVFVPVIEKKYLKLQVREIFDIQRA